MKRTRIAAVLAALTLPLTATAAIAESAESGNDPKGDVAVGAEQTLTAKQKKNLDITAYSAVAQETTVTLTFKVVNLAKVPAQFDDVYGIQGNRGTLYADDEGISYVTTLGSAGTCPVGGVSKDTAEDTITVTTNTACASQIVGGKRTPKVALFTLWKTDDEGVDVASDLTEKFKFSP